MLQLALRHRARCCVYCDHEDALVSSVKALEADDRVEIVRTKNRFNPPLFNGYQDIMMMNVVP